jgi:hypothetical protein
MLMRLFRSLMPREERFIENFVAHSGQIVAAADALTAYMAANPQDRDARSAELSAVEKAADGIEHKTIVALHRAFITPFDRADIHTLILALDDIVDLTEEVAQRAALYKVRDFTPRMLELGAMIQASTRLIAKVLPLLADVSANAREIRLLCEQISQIESAGDQVLSDALGDLIEERPNIIDFLGRKEVYDLLESVTDRCDDVGDVIEGIVLDHV